MNSMTINRLCLQYFADLQSVPQTAAEAAEYIGGRMRRPARAETDRALSTLETLGYLARAEATAADEPLYKITASGLRQILKRVSVSDLDPMVWG
jgi:hypothetical protein